MSEINRAAYLFLGQVADFVASLGLVVVIAAWLSVSLAAIGMAIAISKHRLGGRWQAALIVGIASLAAHLVDYGITLRASSDLSLEANPIWYLVVDKIGVNTAIWYGLTGKILLSVLSFELFVYYLIGREQLIPRQAGSLARFWLEFGRARGARFRIHSYISLFSFLFALVGPFCLYVALLNTITDERLYMKLPSMPLMLVGYLVVLVLVYVVGNYWSSKRKACGRIG